MAVVGSLACLNTVQYTVGPEILVGIKFGVGPKISIAKNIGGI